MRYNKDARAVAAVTVCRSFASLTWVIGSCTEHSPSDACVGVDSNDDDEVDTSIFSCVDVDFDVLAVVLPASSSNGSPLA